jgi:hypothetical protein
VQWRRKSILVCIKEIETRRMLESHLQDKLLSDADRYAAMKERIANKRNKQKRRGTAFAPKVTV